MALPKIQHPLFDITIPSTGKKVQYRPFTVKEEKILLIAQESKDLEQIILAIKQIINNCIEDINVDKLAMFDLEYLLLHLRAKSVSNEIAFRIRDPETKEEIDLTIDINDIQIEKKPGHTNKIDIGNGIGLYMTYPKINQMIALKTINRENKNQILFEIMMGCIESVVTEDEVLQLADFSKKEVEDFIESLSPKNVKEIKTFFDTMPVMRFEKKYKRSDGTKKTFVAEGTETFFI